MTYDCFTFFNELELLELRLHELAGVVDKFVLVEATQTHTNKPKPLHYQENRERFSAFHDKIIHVVVDDMPVSSDAWIPENFQRNCISRGLAQCRPDDLILVSDVDEIPRAATVQRFRQEHSFPRGLWVDIILRPTIGLFLSVWKFSRGRGRVERNHPLIWKFKQTTHRHFINCVTVNPPSLIHWYGTRILFYRDFRSAQEVRWAGRKVVDNGGWHFNSMGGVERIVEKYKSFAHQDFNNSTFLDPNRLSDVINQGKALLDQSEEMKFVALDDSYPRYLMDHPEKYSTWIKPV